MFLLKLIEILGGVRWGGKYCLLVSRALQPDILP